MSARRLGFPALFVLAVTAALAASGASPAARAQETPPRNAAPDAFYLSLLRDGKAEMLRGDAVAAKKSFRLACFGFLEQPVILAEGLVRLGLAQAALADREAFVETFSRLAEVEERFASYALAALSADERRGFEDKALEWIAPEALRALPSFASLLARKTELDLARLAPRERLRELEKRAAAEPTAVRWRILLAQDDVANDRLAKALSRLDGVGDAVVGDSPGVTAGCLRGRALAGLKRCEEAIVALGGCASVTSDPLLAEAQLTCLNRLERSDAAREFAARISKPAADAPAVRKAIAHLAPPLPLAAKEAPAVAEAPPPARASKQPPSGSPVAPATGAPGAPPAAKEGAGPTNSPPKRVTPASPAPTATEERALATARGMLKAGDNRDELGRGLALVRPVADRLPGRGDLQLLAGEIAYRAGQWATGAEYFRRSTPDRRGPIDPTQRFYFAVCLFEAGKFAEAAQVAASGLEKLPRPPFVESYLQKIRGHQP